MPITIAHLRRWLVALAVLLVAVVAGFLGYARYRMHRAIHDLPERLGMQIERSSDGFTYSQSVKGRTAFTVHASKAVQYKGGSRAALHDVSITLYGPQGDRSDRIYGSEFDYDQKSGLITAQGAVQIDLRQASNPQAGQAGSAAGGTIQIKTSGLVFNQKTQLANTSQYVEFSTPKAAGHSTGASYDASKGVLILNSAIELSSSSNGNPVVIHASHAQFLRDSRQAFLQHPVCDFQQERSSSDQAIVYFRPDGSAERVDSQGHVHVKSDSRQDLTAQAANILLDRRSQPQRVDASGGLILVSNGDIHHMHGSGTEGTLQFGANGVLQHAQVRDAVSFVDQQLTLPSDPQGSETRELRASQIDIDFTPGPDRHPQADKILAAGGAAVVLHTIRTTAPSQNTTIKGDQLLATLQNGNAVASLHGSGHTSILDIARSGATDQSTGDMLQVTFAPSRPTASAERGKQKAAPRGTAGASEIQSAVQQGNVTITQTPPSGKQSNGKSQPSMKATAQRVDYDATGQVLHLQGSPRIDDGSMDLAASSIDYHRDSGNAVANGNVKATYIQQANPAGLAPGFGGQGPAHVVAASATLDRAKQEAIFRGQARLWQGANSVSAPVIELSRAGQSFTAHGESSTAAASTTVATVLASASASQHQPGIVRVRSHELLYSEADRKAVFRGPVAAEDGGATIRSDQTEVFLLPAQQSGSAKKSSPGAEQASGQIDRIVATGHVVLQQPGRRGTGEQLIYTGRDRKFVLTGTPSTPPRLYDQQHGTVTGVALIFNSQDDSVSVSGGQSGAVTDTRAPK